MPYILGVKVDAHTRHEALERVDTLMHSSGQHLITTPNPEIVVAAQQDAEFCKILNQAALALPDGVGLMFAAWLLNHPFQERIAGSDFVWDLARLAAKRGYTIQLMGGKVGVAQEAAKRLKIKVERLKIVEANPDILLVALGHGKQEKWIVEHLQELPSVKIAMGVGGALDFIAGHVTRAPRLLRLLGLEWLWRLVRQPWRAPRIWRAVVVFSWLVLRAKFRGTI